MGWIIAMFADESATAPLGYWDGDEFQLVADEANAGDALNSSEFASVAAGNTIQTARAAEGDFQQRFTDFDIRTLSASQTITLM